MNTLALSYGESGAVPRAAGDLYTEPAAVTEALFRVERFVGNVVDPARGRGVLIGAAERGQRLQPRATWGVCAGSDIADSLVCDFTRPGWAPPVEPVHNIICNPPYKHSSAFVARALELASCKVAMFLRLQWLESERRHRELFSSRPPHRVWVFTHRVGMWKGDEADPHDSGMLPHAWMVWDLTVPWTPGRAELRWISARDRNHNGGPASRRTHA